MAREARWDQVLDTAARLFSSQGFAATSIREVAAQAAFSKAGLYYHIREKEDLLYHVCVASIGAILAQVRPAVADEDDPLARLAAVIQVHSRYFHDHPDNLKVLTYELGQLPEARRAEVQAIERQYLDLIRGIIHEGQLAGQLTDMDPTVAAFMLLSLMNGLHNWYDPRGPLGAAGLAQTIQRIFLSGLTLGPIDRANKPRST